ncbi:MAG: HEAT repeat domain-containing protein [Deltaproteobacteria bacterium]|nr:HEAT repeat domain-containing protein [Deltaproteobacteria bacterium]
MATSTHPVAAGLAAQSPEGAAVSAAVQALARAARSFVLYDASNEVIRQLLQTWREKALAAVAQLGETPLEFRPFDVTFRGEVVYHDPDREKSLAFKLFRDGVRRITLLPGVEWSELLQLLQIVALRYTAVRQQEDDAVTLLRKADLPGLKLVAVEGFAPAEERPEPESGEKKREGVKPPEGWDTPLPRLPGPGPLAWQPVSPEALEALRESESEEALVRTALGLGRDLLSEAVRGHWPRPNRDLLQYFCELRDALLAEGKLGPLRQLVDLIAEAGAGDIREELLAGLGDARTLDLILEALPEGATDLPPELLAFVPLLGLEAALDKLAVEQLDRRRALLLKLVLARLPRAADAVLRRLPQLEPQLARALATGLAARAPEKALEVGRLLLQQRSEPLRLEGLEALARAPGEIPLPPLLSLLSDPSEGMRTKVIEVLGRRGDETVMPALLDVLQTQERAPREVEALGRALADLAPIQAGRHFAGWLRPKGRFLIGPSAQQKRLQWAAVAGMACLPGDEPERQLQALAQDAEDELRKHCLAALARRRKGAAHG